MEPFEKDDLTGQELDALLPCLEHAGDAGDC